MGDSDPVGLHPVGPDHQASVMTAEDIWSWIIIGLFALILLCVVVMAAGPKQ